MTDEKPKQLKTYVMFHFDMVVDSVRSKREVQDRDFRKLDIPEGAHGFWFFDCAPDGGPQENKSATYLVVKKIMTTDDISREVDDADRLLDYMDTLNVDRLIMNRKGGFETLPSDKTIVINEEKKVLYPPEAVARAKVEEDIERLRQQKAAKPFGLRKP